MTRAVLLCICRLPPCLARLTSSSVSTAVVTLTVAVVAVLPQSHSHLVSVALCSVLDLVSSQFGLICIRHSSCFQWLPWLTGSLAYCHSVTSRTPSTRPFQILLARHRSAWQLLTVTDLAAQSASVDHPLCQCNSKGRRI